MRGGVVKRRRTIGGTSLIEAMVAVALLAMMMLAVAGSQLAMMRTQRAVIWREHALWLADARIEGARATPDAASGLAAPAAAMLPAGAIAIEPGRGGVQVAIASWRDGDAAASAGCEAAGAATAACVRMPFGEARIDDR